MAKAASGKASGAKPLTTVELRAAATALPLPAGLFAFQVTGAQPARLSQAGGLQFPALHVAPGPGCPPDRIDFIGAPHSMGTWLFEPGSLLVVKVEEPGATLILTSVRSAGTQPLDVDVRRLDGAKPHVASAATGAAPPPVPDGKQSLKLRLHLHIRNRGDADYEGARWAGMLAENLWVEAFSVEMTDTLSSQDIEYKGLSANGFETPWLSDNAVCGTKGISLPIVGFAIRLKPSVAARYDCEYSGYFQSGATVGPLLNGAPCRSKVAADPLVGLLVRVLRRAPAATRKTEAAGRSTRQPAADAPAPQQGGPRFSRFREAIKAVGTRNPATKGSARKPADTGPLRKK